MDRFNSRLAGIAALVLLVTVCGGGAASAAVPVDDNGVPLWIEREWHDFPVRLQLADHAALEALLQTVPIATFNREQITIVFDTPKTFHLVLEPRVTEAEATALTAAGYALERLPDTEQAWRTETERLWAERAAAKAEVLRDEIFYYPTHAEVGQILAAAAIEHPAIAQDYSWGSSVQGRALWAITISDNVGVAEAEAEVRLSSTMHGNEPVGMVMLLNLVEYLTDNYGQLGYEDVTDLVDNYEIHIFPLHNPDGYVAHTRGNANGVDLNRNYPAPDPLHDYQEIETIHFMNHGDPRHFVVSSNAHTGALVVNYPWDYTYELTPDDDAIIQLSLEYSQYNLPMYNGAFDQGITNGAMWYITQGCLQDWSYFRTGCIDVTLELSNDHWPSESLLDDLWDDNRESYMHYVKAARYGVNGVVTAAGSGQPLAATITIVGNEKQVVTDPAHGDYYKLLDSGTYDVVFEANGYVTQTIYDVATVWGTPTVLDVVMQPLAEGDLSGVVTDLGDNPLDATVEIRTYPTLDLVEVIAVSAAEGGAYSTTLFYGEYQLKAMADGYVSATEVVTIGATPTVQDFALLQAQELFPIADDFESGTDNWTGGWALATPPEGHSPENSLTDSPDGDYESNEFNPTTMTFGGDLTDAMEGELSFWAKWDIENNWDAVVLEVSTDGGANWSAVATQHTAPASGQGVQQPAGMPVYEGTQANWIADTVDLTPWFEESDVRFRFVLMSDGSVEKDGFYFDDFVMRVVRPAGAAPVTIPERLTAQIAAFPNPFNPQTTVKFTNPRAGRVDLAVFDVTGRLVRHLLAEQMTAGQHHAVWDGRSDAGQPAGSGVYFARLRVSGEVRSVKLMLVK